MNTGKGRIAMKLIGELKEKVEQAKTVEEAKQIIKEAGIELDDKEMEQIYGGTTTIMMRRPFI